MAAVTIVMLAVYSAAYLRKVESLSIFVSTHDYYIECMRLPGGWLTWVSTYLTQTFYYPWLGAIVYAIILSCIMAAAYKAFRLPKFVYPVLLIIPSAAILALLNLGYVIFSLKTPGYAFLLPVGTLCSVLAFWGYRSLRVWWLRAVSLAIICIFGYVVAGYYALLTAAVCAVYEVISVFVGGRPWWQPLAIMALGVLGIWLMPELWLTHADTDLPMAMMYRCPLPRFYEGESSLYAPYYIISIALLVLAAAAAIRSNKATDSNIPTVVCTTVGAVALVWAIVGRYDDSNFRLTLNLERALWDQEWEHAIDIMSSFTEEPTRLNVILSDMALIRTGEAADKMFAMPIGSAPYDTERSLRATHDVGAMLFSYHMGQINYAYRWAMENKVEYGMNVDQLKMMTKCALLNGDYGVARKCIDTLRRTAFHGKWADRYAAYLDDPSLIDKDPEMSAVKKLMFEAPMFIEDRGQLEGYVWPMLANVQSGNDEVLELSLISALVCCQIDAFAERLPFYARLHEKLPVHLQEGILMWSRVHENTGFRQYNIDQAVKDRFKNFLKTQKQYSTLPLERQAELMRPAFGDTYWYYYLYTRNLKII